MSGTMERFFWGLDGAGLCDVSESLGFVLSGVASSSDCYCNSKLQSISSERRLMSLGEERPAFMFCF